jgi:hypothetical protein
VAVQFEPEVVNETKWLAQPSYTRTSFVLLRAVLRVGGEQTDPFQKN